MSKIAKSILSLLFVAAMCFSAAFFVGKTTVGAVDAEASLSVIAGDAFVMEKGASIRADYRDGLRYSATLSKNAYDALEAKYGKDKISFGTFILPEYYVIKYGAPDAEKCFGENPVYVWGTDTCGENQHIILHNTNNNADFDGENYIADGYVVGMKGDTKKNLNVSYSGYVYLKAEKADGTSEYLFAKQNDNERSMLYIACKALEDPDNAEYQDVLNAYLSAYNEYCASVSKSADFNYTVKVLKDGKEESSEQKTDKLFAEIDGTATFGEIEGYVLDKAASNLAGRVYPDNSLTIIANYKKKVVLDNPAGKNEYFGFAKETEKTADYAAAFVKDGYYNVDATGVSGEVSSVTVKDVLISGFSLKDGCLKIPAGELAKVENGESVIRIFTATECYEADIVVADYVVTTAEEFKIVLPFAEASGFAKLIVLGNDISKVGDYTNTASGSWFNGTFDGRGYTVSDINITSGSLFTIVSPYAKIQNVALVNVTGVSAVVAQTFHGTISDVYVQGTLSGAPSGLVFVAPNEYEFGKIIKNVIVNVSATGAWVDGGTFGLIAGVSVVCGATVTNCYAISSLATGLYGTEQWKADKDKDKVYSSESLFLANASALISDFNKEYWSIDGGLIFGNTVLLKETVKMQPENGKHELFSFAKETEKTSDYAAANVENGYYKVILPVAAGSVSELKIKGVKINDYSYDDSSKTLKIAVSEIGAIPAGNGEMVISTPNKNYGADIVVADYVITTAEEFRNVTTDLSIQKSTSYIVLANDINNAGELEQKSAAADDYYFQGTFDGRGYTVSDITVKGYGVFVQIGPAGTVKNVAMVNAEQTQNSGGAILCGWNYGTIENVYVQGSAAGQSGLTITCGASAKVLNCIVNVHGTHSDGWWYTVGGVIAGSASVADGATIENCYGISDNFAKGLYPKNGNAVTEGFYATAAELLNAFGGELPESFGEFWELKDGKLYFGNVLILG